MLTIRFLKAVGQYQPNQVVELPEAIARAWLAMPGTAAEVPADPHARALSEVLTQMTPLFEAQSRSLVEELRRTPPAAARPDVNGHALGSRGVVEFGVITPTGSEVDKRRGPGHWLRKVIQMDSRSRVQAYEKTYEEIHAELTRPWEEGGYGCRTMIEGSGPGGGYTTPVVYESQVFEVASEQQIIVPAADNKPMGARQVEWPALNQYGIPAVGQSAFFGGIQVLRKGETVHRTESTPTFKKIQMLAQDLTAYTTISRDLIQDATVSIDAMVIRLIGEAVGWREDWEAINGNGAGQFLGFLNAPCTLALARTTSGHIKYQDVFNLKSRMLTGAKRPCWIVHPYAMVDIYSLQDPSGKFIFVPNAYVGGTPTAAAAGGISYRMEGYLLGDPIFTTEKVAPLGTIGDLSFVDRAAYWFGRRSGLEVGLSEHFLFDQDEIAIRAKVRNDGKPGLRAPIYLADGSQSNQVSGFTVLAT